MTLDILTLGVAQGWIISPFQALTHLPDKNIAYALNQKNLRNSYIPEVF